MGAMPAETAGSGLALDSEGQGGVGPTSSAARSEGATVEEGTDSSLLAGGKGEGAGSVEGASEGKTLSLKRRRQGAGATCRLCIGRDVPDACSSR